MSSAPPFEQAMRACASALTAAFAIPAAFQPEDQLKRPLAELIVQAGNALGGMAIEVLTKVWVAALRGRPDMGVAVRGLISGYVELKAPGKGARLQQFKGEDKIQWEKFKNLPNLIYTDGNEWAHYQAGELAGPILRLSGDMTRDGAAAISPANAVALLEMLCARRAAWPRQRGRHAAVCRQRCGAGRGGLASTHFFHRSISGRCPLWSRVRSSALSTSGD
ncbi:MAG: hypothetical protein H7Z42_05185 [Roseiflexaceae bacterium]|nr:hypothetical protein [Roseiflexaceae bacterium]